MESREIKGLDIVRRDWSSLAKRAGQYVSLSCVGVIVSPLPPSLSYVLDQILSGSELDKVIEEVKSYLHQGGHTCSAGRARILDLQSHPHSASGGS